MIKVYIDPWDKNYLDNKLFDSCERLGRKMDHLLPWVFLRDYCKEEGVEIETSDKIPGEKTGIKYLYYSFGQYNRYRLIRSRKDIVWGSFYLFEPPIRILPKASDIYFHLEELISNFHRLYTTSSIKDINKCYNLNYGVNTQLFFYPQSYSSIIEQYWNSSDRKFLVMVNSYRYSRLKSNEYYSERIKALSYFLKKDLIDLFGNDWDKVRISKLSNIIKGILWGVKWKSLAKVRDIFMAANISSKLKDIKNSGYKYKLLSEYKFAICYESMGINGFITEKIFDCFFSGTIPVYLGAPNIHELIPKNTYIDKRDFSSYKELHNYLINMDNDTYNNIRNNIRNFILSEKFYPFTMECFAKNFLKDVNEDMNLIKENN